MNAFTDAQSVESLAFLEIVPFLHQTCEAVIDTRTIKGFVTDGCVGFDNPKSLSEEFQKTVGDFIVKTSPTRADTIEVKAEEAELYGNIFLETFSNRHPGHINPGWLVKIKCSKLFYYFCRERWLLSFDMQKLRSWALELDNIFRFPEKKQGKRKQLNITSGHCVPIDVLIDELNPNQFFFEGEPGNVSRKISGKEQQA